MISQEVSLWKIRSVTGNSHGLIISITKQERGILADIYYDGQFVNTDEIDADWEVPDALNGISKWYRDAL